MTVIKPHIYILPFNSIEYNNRIIVSQTTPKKCGEGSMTQGAKTTILSS